VSATKDENNLFADFLDDYFAESEEHLAVIRRNLLAIEPFVQQPEIDRTLVDELFRSFHSIKGLSGMVGVKEAEQVAHEMESYLRSLRDKQVLLTSEGLDALISGTKMLELVIATHRQQNPLPDVTSVINQLIAVLPNDSPSDNGGGAKKEEAQEQAVETTPVVSEAQEQAVETAPVVSEAQEQAIETAPVTSGAQENVESLSSTPVSLFPRDLPPLSLKPEESTKLAAALQNGTQAWRFVFIPEPALSQRGVNVNNIRQRLQSIGEIIHASPQVTPNGGIAFNFVVASQTDAASFAPWQEDGLVYTAYLEEGVRSQESEVVGAGLPDKLVSEQANRLNPPVQEPQVGPQESQVVGAGLLDKLVSEQTNRLNPPVQEPQVGPQESQVRSPESGVVGAGLNQISAVPLSNPINPPVQQSPPLPISPSPSPPVTSAPAPSNFVRVDLARLDELMQMVGELVITRARLGDNLKALKGSVSEPQLRTLRETNLALERQLRNLREGVMRVRLVPIGEIFARMQFVIRDIARESKKQIALELIGQTTEIDKFVVERMMDPLLHLVRNAVSHGLESEADRIAQGKSPEGKIALRAATAGEMVVIEIEDDGRGVDVEKVTKRARSQGLIATDATPDMASVLDIICSSGFSTRDQADLTSGRGVGMAVVKNTVQELGGFLTLDSQVGVGTKFTIQLPLTLAIADALTVSIGGQTFAVPQSSVREVLETQPTAITVFENNEIFSHRGSVLPLIRLADFFGLASTSPETQNGKRLHVVVVGSGLSAVGLLVDRILGQREIVVRPLTDPLVQVVGIAGATELGDGRIVLILDTAALLHVGRLASWKVTRRSSLPLR
jgi:two-component system chemotaxis sensor kinase CheA